VTRSLFEKYVVHGVAELLDISTSASYLVIAGAGIVVVWAVYRNAAGPPRG